MTGPKGNSKFCLPERSRDPLRKQNSLFPRWSHSWSVLFYLPTQHQKQLWRNRLLFAGWLINLLRFQGTRPDHMRIKSSSCCFPRELISFVHPRMLVSFDPQHVTRFPTTSVLQLRHWSFVLFPQAKHLQFVSGVDAVSFWLATYSWDFINYLLPMFGIIIMFAAFQVDSLKDDLGAIVLLLVIILKKLIYYVILVPLYLLLRFLNYVLTLEKGKISFCGFPVLHKPFLSRCLSVFLFDVMNYFLQQWSWRLKLH